MRKFTMRMPSYVHEVHTDDFSTHTISNVMDQSKLVFCIMQLKVNGKVIHVFV